MHALKLKTVHNVFKYKEIFNLRSNKCHISDNKESIQLSYVSKRISMH